MAKQKIVPEPAAPPETFPGSELVPGPRNLANPQNLYNQEREADLCGAILIDPSQLDECLAIGLESGDFHDIRNKEVWNAFLDLKASGLDIDPNMVGDVLARIEKLEIVGGQSYLTSLLNLPGNTSHAASYAKIVKDFADRRHDYYELMEDTQKKGLRMLDLSRPYSETVPVRKTNWTIAELMATEFPDPAGPLPGIIPTGLTILGGRPKRGKSWLMLQFSYALAAGRGKFLDHDLTQKHVIYYALEDTPRRIKDRLAKFDPSPDATIEFERELKPLHLGGLEQIEKAAEDHYLIVIDTLGRAMPGRDFTKDAGLFADVLGRLQIIAIEHNIAIVVILHTRKPTGFEHDPIDDILGSTQGLTAAPDCVLALYREQGKTYTRLEGRGRDFDDIDLTIEFDPITCAWQLIGKTDQVQLAENKADILEGMKELGKAKVSKIAEAIKKDRGNTAKRCAELWTQGYLKKDLIDGITYYFLPEADT